jgi:hypothetical protein
MSPATTFTARLPKGTNSISMMERFEMPDKKLSLKEDQEQK